jgi:hypothetical protein
MLDILRLPMPKETLSKLTPEERSSFLLLGYASNQVNVLWKLVSIATNYTPDDPVEQRVSGAQIQIYVRLTIGVMWEAWLLVERGFLKSKVGRDYVPRLDRPAQEALDRLKKRFGPEFRRSETIMLSITRRWSKWKPHFSWQCPTKRARMLIGASFSTRRFSTHFSLCRLCVRARNHQRS